MHLAAVRARFGRGTIVLLVLLSILAVGVIVALPQISARLAERRTAEEATEIGDALLAGYARTGTFPARVVADNTDGRHPEVRADGRPLTGARLARGMAVYFYSSESGDLGIGFCLEHRTDSGEPNAFAAYGALAKASEGGISQTGHGTGCLSAE